MKSLLGKLVISVAVMIGAVLIATYSTSSKQDKRELPPAQQAATTIEADDHSTEHEQVGAVIPTFNFISQHDERFLSKQLDDKVWVASFVFTRCQSMCPMIAKKLQTVQSTFNGQADFKLLSFSLDPDNDTPLKLKAYGQKYAANFEQWQFLTGNWQEIKALMQNGFKVPTPDQPASHTDRLVLIDRGMKIFGYYSANDTKDMQRMEDDIRSLLNPRTAQQ
jgi:protein SCO1